ncbi:hypothetical protein SS50377_23605 [Spironucleus salmonicida]|uniref:Uncharacterized protein n=1 Tax=Spironucleus salmonicida TaxID=348837 RepID=V6LVB3_9EUKA|nr:hypothetical protein SS50377_23605 [Spironucleus salmonicida]|eukprot:EST48587.1 Hypothetical protein SS50377_11198 [Spironucleus salmonicida]
MYIRTRQVAGQNGDMQQTERNSHIYNTLSQNAYNNLKDTDPSGTRLYTNASNLTNTNINKSNVRTLQTNHLRAPTSNTFLSDANNTAQESYENKMLLVDQIPSICDTITALNIEIQAIREQGFDIQNEVKSQIQKEFTTKYADLTRRVEQVSHLSNAIQTKNDALTSREQLRDNIISIHDEALTNFSQVLQKLERKISDLESKSIGKDELDVRINNLEHDVKQMWSSMQNQTVALQQEVNSNITNIMGILGLLEQKNKSVQLQLEQIRMIRE